MGFLLEPWDLPFMQRAFAVAAVVGLVCGVVGVFVVLRGMAFIGDAVAHSAFPGVALAYAFNGNLLLGGAAAGITTAVLIAVVSQNRRLKEDTVIGVFFAFAFGLGIVLVSTRDSWTTDLSSFLFGQVLAVSPGDVWTVAGIGAVLVVLVLVLRKELVAVSLDRETARAAGLPVLRLDLTLYIVVTATIVMSLEAVGNILVLALLITPAATARMLTERLWAMTLLASAIGCAGSVAGLYVSYAYDLAAGGSVVVVLTGVFAVVWCLAPRHGPLARVLRLRRGRTAAISSPTV
ncbi:MULTISPECIES: anchored repeat-type ABC transporter permease subunit [unclassified Streptomyces]|uniref:anchored repeat-type ABC transporter permease subunit n=1 Tax=unclassified Streptomyces TaxID=2593676 RepID=UPI00081DA08F|nr:MULTISPECIES: anchored repeat-type ABC transporter permease subunit [unclassified Streptomyces]MYZ36575.1 anchored repeat-type ABC transporter permease subunit [Streptomyces sp. SID4917]SCF84600.1 manganese/iron transport system permease protein [Streptomyces sp. MnatMP-M17]